MISVWSIIVLVVTTLFGVWLFIKGMKSRDDNDAIGLLALSGIVIGICILCWIGVFYSIKLL